MRLNACFNKLSINVDRSQLQTSKFHLFARQQTMQILASLWTRIVQCGRGVGRLARIRPTYASQLKSHGIIHYTAAKHLTILHIEKWWIDSRDLCGDWSQIVANENVSRQFLSVSDVVRNCIKRGRCFSGGRREQQSEPTTKRWMPLIPISTTTDIAALLRLTRPSCRRRRCNDTTR